MLPSWCGQALPGLKAAFSHGTAGAFPFDANENGAALDLRRSPSHDSGARHISFAYSRIVRSEENQPIWAVLTALIAHQEA